MCAVEHYYLMPVDLLHIIFRMRRVTLKIKTAICEAKFISKIKILMRDEMNKSN